MKRWITVVVVGLLLILASGFASHTIAQIRRIDRLDARYQRVQRGMDSATVFTIMNEDTFSVLLKGVSDKKEMDGWWNETRLNPSDDARIQTANEYTAPELFTTIRWVFTFDKNEKVIGKHRFG